MYGARAESDNCGGSSVNLLTSYTCIPIVHIADPIHMIVAAKYAVTFFMSRTLDGV